MSLVLRRHLSHSQAHILVGVLASGGISSLVVGDLACQLYGGTTILDCVVLVPEEEMEDAENFLRSDLADEPIDETVPPEQGPPDGDPPGIGDILPASVLLFSACFAARAFLVIMMTITTHISPEGHLRQAMTLLLFTELPFLVVCMVIHSIGAGLLLKIIRGYRRGSLFCRIVVKALLVVLIL